MSYNVDAKGAYNVDANRVLNMALPCRTNFPVFQWNSGYYSCIFHASALFYMLTRVSLHGLTT